MPGCSLLQLVPASSEMRAPCPQQIENTGFKSLQSRSGARVARTRARKAASSDTADSAWRQSAIAGPRRYHEWLEASLPCTSTDLLARLPFNDAVKLATLIGTGRITWAEVNAALGAMIKLASADALNDRGTWEAGTRAGEAEIWARYHARCDEVFANDAERSDAGAWSRERLWSRERVIDRLRSARDRELAALRRRSTFSAVRLEPSQAAAPRTQLTSVESDALEKLTATGFIASDDMVKAIDDLASESAAA